MACASEVSYATRYLCQSSLSDWALDGPLYYVIARLLWDPAANPDLIARQWMDGMFGPAAQHMGDFYDAVDQSVLATGRPYSDSPPRDVPGLYDRELLEKALAAIRRAEGVEADENVRRRIAEVATTFRYGLAMIQTLDEQHRFMETGDPEAMQAAKSIQTTMSYYVSFEADQVADELWAKWAHEPGLAVDSALNGDAGQEVAAFVDTCPKSADSPLTGEPESQQKTRCRATG